MFSVYSIKYKYISSSTNSSRWYHKDNLFSVSSTEHSVISKSILAASAEQCPSFKC